MENDADMAGTQTDSGTNAIKSIKTSELFSVLNLCLNPFFYFSLISISLIT